MNITSILIVTLISFGGVRVQASDHPSKAGLKRKQVHDQVQQAVAIPKEPDELVRRETARRLLLPFLHGDVIPVVLGYAAKSWLKCAYDKQWSRLEPKNKKRRTTNSGSVQTGDEGAWLQQLGYTYESEIGLPLREKLSLKEGVVCALHRMGRVAGLIGTRSCSLYLSPMTQTIDQPTYILPNVIPNTYILDAVISASGKKMVVRTHTAPRLSRLDAYALDQEKGTLTKEAFSSTEKDNYRCLAVADKRVALFKPMASSRLYEIVVCDEKQELFISPGWQPSKAAFMENRLLVMAARHEFYGDQIFFIDTSRTVPAGRNRVIGMTTDCLRGAFDGDLAACAETGRIFVTTCFITPRRSRTITQVLQLGVSGSD